MDRKWFVRIVQVAVVSLTIAAVCQEMEKPGEERRWHGVVAGFIPYDFRMPTIDRFKESWWNPYDMRVLTPRAFGIGWSINFYSLLEKLRLAGRGDVSEESFLMPTKGIRDLITQAAAAE